MSSDSSTLEDSEIAKNAAAIHAIEQEEEDLARAIRETERSELTDDTEGDEQSETSSTTGPSSARYTSLDTYLCEGANYILCFFVQARRGQQQLFVLESCGR